MDPFERARQEDAMGYQRWWITALGACRVLFLSLGDEPMSDMGH
jgi:hypothetical protein